MAFSSARSHETYRPTSTAQPPRARRPRLAHSALDGRPLIDEGRGVARPESDRHRGTRRAAARAGRCADPGRATGLCGTDLAIFAGHHEPAAAPLVMGHEMVGIVEAVDGVGPTAGHPSRRQSPAPLCAVLAVPQRTDARLSSAPVAGYPSRRVPCGARSRPGCRAGGDGSRHSGPVSGPGRTTCRGDPRRAPSAGPTGRRRHDLRSRTDRHLDRPGCASGRR